MTSKKELKIMYRIEVRAAFVTYHRYFKSLQTGLAMGAQIAAKAMNERLKGLNQISCPCVVPGPNPNTYLIYDGDIVFGKIIVESVNEEEWE